MAYTYGMGVQREVEYGGWLGRCKRIAKQLMEDIVLIIRVKGNNAYDVARR